VAVAAVAFAAIGTLSVLSLQNPTSSRAPVPAPTAKLKWQQLLWLALFWIPCVCLFSAPSFLYGAASTLNADNTLGLGAFALNFLHQAGGVLLFIGVRATLTLLYPTAAELTIPFSPQSMPTWRPPQQGKLSNG